MPFTAHNPRPFYDAVVTQIGTSTGKNVGRAQTPTDETVPYAVVYPQDETDMDVNLADPSDVTMFEWLVVSVGDTAEQAMLMQQKVRAALLGWQPVVAGVNFGFVTRVGGSPVQRNDNTQPPDFSVTDRFTVFAD